MALSKDMQRANELSIRATQLRDKSRYDWAMANTHLKEMGAAITEMHEVHVELAALLKQMTK
jgi:hypothetical protein